jgi:hypothetical protein
MRSVVHRLRKLERGAAVEEAAASLIIIRSYRLPDNCAADADLEALKAAGFLRGGVRPIRILDNGEIVGLTEQEQQFLAERRRRTR